MVMDKSWMELAEQKLFMSGSDVKEVAERLLQSSRTNARINEIQGQLLCYKAGICSILPLPILDKIEQTMIDAQLTQSEVVNGRDDFVKAYQAQYAYQQDIEKKQRMLASMVGK